MMESNCYFAPRANLEKIGFADSRFDQEGGGALNPHMYRTLGLLPDSTYIVLPGEGSCHQFHGGVTSSRTREEVQHRFHAQLQSLWGEGYRALTREPLYFGSIGAQAQAHLSEASSRAERRYRRMANSGLQPWPETPVKSLDELPLGERD